MDVSPEVRSPRSAYAGIFLLAGSIILFEVALTRVFAIMMWHHFTYMVVSIALLGFGAAGSLLTAGRDAERKDDPTPSLAITSGAYGLSVLLGFGFATKVKLDTLNLFTDKSNLVALLLVYLVISVPMLLGGLAVGRALTRRAQDVNRLYFADLLGSALGGGLSALALDRLGCIPTVFLAGFLGTLSGLVFALGARWGTRLLASIPVLIAAAALVGILGGAPALHLPQIKWKVPDAPGKELGSRTTDMTDKRLSSATAEVEVSRSVQAHPMIGGNFSPLENRKVEARYVTQDGTAPTMLYADASEIGRFPFLRESQACTAYLCREASGLKSPDVLVIGVGGGVDVMAALAFDARHITAVEINKAMIRMVREEYRDYMGRLFEPGGHALADRVELVNSEGRSWLRHSDARYDIIQMSGVDSFTALSTGAYTLSESYLYTVEAIKDFYSHLNEGGYVNYSRFILGPPKKPRETLRLVNIARTALEELGVADPAAQILVYQGIDWASTIIKRGAFTAREVQDLVALADRLSYRGLVFDPTKTKDEQFGPPPNLSAGVRDYFAQALAAKTPESLRPMLADQESLLVELEKAYVLRFKGDATGSEAGIADLVARRAGADDGGEARTFFSGLVGGAVDYVRRDDEAWLQKRRDFETLLRGDAAARDRFVAQYEYDLRPCTDDRPFFFNYYKWRALFGGASDQGESSEIQKLYHPDFPVGHAVLLASLAQILLLAGVLVFLPLRKLRREGVRTPGKFRYLVYFSALGTGFMFVELALMQKMVIFLGHPTYALGVVLSSLLAFTGIGSLVSGRIRRIGRGTLFLMMLAVLAAIALSVVGVNRLLPELLGKDFAARVGVVVALLMPVGLALGLGFPSGVRILSRNCPQLLPWGWAVNGFTSVMASILAIVVGQEVGFTRVLWIAAGVYALGFLVMKPEEPAAAAKA